MSTLLKDADFTIVCDSHLVFKAEMFWLKASPLWFPFLHFLSLSKPLVTVILFSVFVSLVF